MVKKFSVMLILNLLILSVFGCALSRASSAESLTTTAYLTTFTWSEV